MDTANAKRDEHLRSADFFDTKAHPTATFESTRVARTKSPFLPATTLSAVVQADAAMREGTSVDIAQRS